MKYAILFLCLLVAIGCEPRNNITIVVKDDGIIEELDLSKITDSDDVIVVKDSPSSFDNEVSGDESSNDIEQTEHRQNDTRDR